MNYKEEYLKKKQEIKDLYNKLQEESSVIAKKIQNDTYTREELLLYVSLSEESMFIMEDSEFILYEDEDFEDN
jgi:hypothetical protein